MTEAYVRMARSALVTSFLVALATVFACSSGDDAGSTSTPSSGGTTGGAPAGGNSSGGATTISDAGDGGIAFAGAGGDSAVGAAGSPAAGAGGVAATVCTSTDRSGCKRGMYVSPYTDHIGQVTFSGDDLVYAYLLGDDAKEQRLLDFVSAQGIDSLALYNLNVILADDTLKDDLVSFMASARAAGVERIEAIGSEVPAAWDAIHDFHEQRAAFDGFVTEIEFWAGGATFDDFVSTLEYVRSLDWRAAPSGATPTLSSYLGWPDQAQVMAMAPLLDRVYLHAYVDTAAQAYSYVAERCAWFAAENTGSHRVAVQPIFSAEDHDFSAGAETFMGEWLRDQGLVAAEQQFLDDWANAGWGEELPLAGFQYYEYFFLDKYVD